MAAASPFMSILAAPRRPAGIGWIRAVTQTMQNITVRRKRARTRRALTAIIDQPHLLADVGLSRIQAEAEASASFWR